MQAALEFAPLLAFLVAYRLRDIYFGTAVLMAAMVALLLIDLLRTRRIPMMHGISAALVLVFGTATLLLRNQHFIQWKPTVFAWVLALAFLGSSWIGERTLTERLFGAALGPALGGDAPPDAATWRRLNALWAGFYVLLGGLNLAVAYTAPEHVWVAFKVFGMTLLTLLFVVAQGLWLARRPGAAAASQPPA